MNYIKHLTGFFDKLVQDDRLNPTHISLYLALFQFWNLQRFKNPISISREEVMRLSKISSKATYHKCMRELHAYRFIDYDPSYNPYRGSLITLHNLELTHEQVQNSVRKRTKKQTSIEQVNGQHQEQVIEQVNEPSINYTNIINDKKNTSFYKPSIEEVIDFFKKNSCTEHAEVEAETFFNYFESNGWLVGGKAKMKNWQAAARNWIKRSQEYKSTSSNRSTNLSSGNLSVNQNKDYSVPL